MPEMQQDTDVIRDVLNGNVNAFEQLVEQYRDYVFMIVNTHIPQAAVEDVAQDVFLRAYNALPSFSMKSPFKHWLAGIASRTCCDYWRKKYRSAEQPVSAMTSLQKDWMEQVIATESFARHEELSKKEEARALLHQAMLSLSAEERSLLTSVHIEGNTVREAAALLGINIVSTKVRLFRARNKLHKVLGKMLEPEE